MTGSVRPRGAVATFALLACLGIAAALAHEPARSCEEAKRLNGWCEAGKVGYVASLEIRSHRLYETLDAHGHDIEPSAVTCATCREAIRTNGFCAVHRMGYVGGEAFMSPLTYHLATGRAIDPEKITCPVCRKHTRGIGWCDTHQVGIVGYRALDDRKDFEGLTRAYAILQAAIETSARCENCAAAMVAEGYCAIQHIKYVDGRATD